MYIKNVHKLIRQHWNASTTQYMYITLHIFLIWLRFFMEIWYERKNETIVQKNNENL